MARVAQVVSQRMAHCLLLQCDPAALRLATCPVRVPLITTETAELANKGFGVAFSFAVTILREANRGAA